MGLIAPTMVLIAGLVFAGGSVIVLLAIQIANQLTFLQLLALGAVLGGIPTTVTLWVIRVLYDVKTEVAKLSGLPKRVRALEDKNA